MHWEYTWLSFTGRNEGKQLAALGRNGWEAVCWIPTGRGALLLKRPLPGTHPATPITNM